jgi:hypothetical protein
MKMNQWRKTGTQHTRVRSAILTCVLLLTIVSWGAGGTPAHGVPPVDRPDQKEAGSLIRHTAQATEQAWETFHQAAIGGTLASPAVQSVIEQQLHEARSLLMEARQAERANRLHDVKSLTRKVRDITQHIVQASREKKQ